MKKASVFLELHRQKRLSFRRNQLWGNNRSARFFMWGVWFLGLLYVAFIGILLGFAVNKDGHSNGFEAMSGILPFILLIDFLLRLTVKQTPSQLVKPYLLLPIPKNVCTDSFILDDLLSPFNLIWQSFFIPFGLITIFPSYGFGAFLAFIVLLQLVMLLNSQWYLLIRSLTSINLLWWILPVVVAIACAIPAFVGNQFSIISFLSTYGNLGNCLYNNILLLWLGLPVSVLFLFFFNRIILRIALRSELNAGKEHSTFSAFAGKFIDSNRVGTKFLSSNSAVDVYLQLELLSLVRNKNLRKTFIIAVVTMVVISAVMSFTSIFTDSVMQIFWLFYCFSLFAAVFLVKIMCYEGNYIDCLMVHKDSMFALLKAKYLLFLAIQIIPFVILLPTTFKGVYGLGDLVAYALFSSGLVNFIYFQLAPYNNQTTTLNTKLMGKGGTMNNYTQMMFSLIAFALPLSTITLLENLFNHRITNIVIGVIGLNFICTSHWWLKSVLQRMKKRKEFNLNAFRQTRM